MRLGGLLKLSTLDYPRRLSAVIFTQGCNFHCPYCQNPDLTSPSGELLDEVGVLAFLEKRKSHLDGVVLSGGEPTLQGDLPHFLKKIKSLGYPIKLDTNGSRPEMVKELLEKRLIDYVALDLKDNPENYSPALAPPAESQPVLSTLQILKEFGLPHEYRTTLVRPFVTFESFKAIASHAAGEYPLYLQLYRGKRVLNPKFMERFPNQPEAENLEEFCSIASAYVPCFSR
ncbi:MAG: anaerobic ribonucleoside-triphosphate reductase activating protein [Deltaproteobacteria bacterium]|nr:anaerobic ribonucleoside-triphosphate reductase activating protein [Deltaproteobacteria bacterium]